MSFFSLETNQDRKFGLDLLRFFAIIFVVMGHSKILLPEHLDYVVDKFIHDGVSIFFVLSGFLIGRILLKMIHQERTSFKDLWTFWTRRWMRTLPAYFLVLIFLICYTAELKPTRLPDEWYRYFFFIQNFFVIQPPFFGESWSLSIEEWFYFLIPILFFSLAAIFPKIRLKLILVAIFVVIAAVILYRWHLFNSLTEISEKTVEHSILRQVLSRLDAIMFGVLGAYASIYLTGLWKKLDHFWIPILCTLIFYQIKMYASDEPDVYHAVMMPAIKSLLVLFMLPYLDQLKLKKPNLLTRFITFTSIISYSMYLLNRTIVIDILIKYGMHDNLKKKHLIDINWYWDYIAFFGFTFVLSFLLYKLVERPFIKLRDRIAH